MNRKDEQLISQFMQANKHEIADNGFSRRVLRRLPMPAKVWSDLLTVICVILCAILLYASDGITILFQSIYDIFQTQSIDIINHPNKLLTTMLAISATICFLSIRSAWTSKE